MRFEDTNYLGSNLYYEIVPYQLHGNNPKIYMKTRWKKIIDYVRERAGYKCEICGNSTRKLHTHERYGVCDEFLILKRFVCVCDVCHFTIHPGYANCMNKIDFALMQYAKLNKISIKQARRECDDAFYLWRERYYICDIDWSMVVNEPYNQFLTDIIIEEAANSYHCGNDIVPLAYIPMRY